MTKPNPDPREDALSQWLASLGAPVANVAPASADASFRRYFRVVLAAPWQEADGHATLIAMDAPPANEDCRPYVRVADMLRDAGVHAPRIFAADLAQGFLLMSDLGARTYASALDAQNAGALYDDALDALVRMQHVRCDDALPAYDDALLRREIQLFPDWCVTREFGVAWTPREHEIWKTVSQRLIDSALAQPQVAVHRDWMPRNLMVCARNPGVLDFQDAVRGPITYDLASMLRDAFISWDEEHELDWAIRYWEAARKVALPVPSDFGDFWRSVEWIGLQRHLKVLGIFSRLKHRDGKAAYSQDLPRFFAYAHKVATRYETLRPLARLLEPLMGAARIEAFR